MLGSMSQRMIRSYPRAVDGVLGSTRRRIDSNLCPLFPRVASSANVAVHGAPALVPHEGAAMSRPGTRLTL
jgi:hypothetical protein